MRRNLLIAQSGGPTAAVNATLAGVVERAFTSGDVGKVYGALFGIKGLMENNIINLGEALSDPSQIGNFSHTPASALGSCRLLLPTAKEGPAVYEKIFDTFARWDVGYFVYIGGSDSMDTVYKLSEYARANEINDVRIMGAPKTIENDMAGMDHSPGFGSAAKYIATTFSELWCDCRVYDLPSVTIVEVMGHVGWLTAASALARVSGDAPHLIYLPEVPFSEEQFLSNIRGQLKQFDAIVIAVSEGLRRADGSYVGVPEPESEADIFGRGQIQGTAQRLVDLVRKKIGCRARPIDLSLMQRCAGHLSSPVDLGEARMLGATALDRALVAGGTGRVSVLRRLGNSPYRVEYDTVPVEQILGASKPVPREWINPEGNFITLDMLQYLIPLIGGVYGSETRRGIPAHFHFQLKKNAGE